LRRHKPAAKAQAAKTPIIGWRSSSKARAQTDDQLDEHGKRIGSDSGYGENTVVVEQDEAGGSGPLFQATA